MNLLLSQLPLDPEADISGPVLAALDQQLLNLLFDLLQDELALLWIAANRQRGEERLNQGFNLLGSKKKC